MTPLPTMNYKHDLKAMISYKFPHNDNKMIILVNIKEYQLVQTVSSIQAQCSPPPPPLFYWGGGGVEPLTNFLKRGDLTETQFLEGGDIFQGGCNFSTKNKLKSEILMTKKLTNKNSLLCDNLELNCKILTKNLVTFKR